MANPWPTPQHDHDHIPSSSDAPSQAGRWQATAQPGVNTAIQDCNCSWCSATRHNNPPLWRTTEYQNPRIASDLPVPLANQVLSADNPTNIAAMMNAQQQFGAPQAYLGWDHDTAGDAPLLEEARFPQAQNNAGLDQPQVINAQVTESLRRLAARFVNNPESSVNALRIEPGATGGFQVVIILEVANVLRGTYQ